MIESDNESLLEISHRDDINLVSSIKQKIKSIPLSRCIGRIPEELLKGNVDKYHPQIVSIGPLHHSREELQSMEDRKWLYLHALLSRSSKKASMNTRLKNCVNMLKESENEARKFYEGGNVKVEVNSDAFVEMLLVDGCFIIELLLKYSAKELRRGDDPFFTSMEMFLRLRWDLVLLENQVPFFLLHRLFKLVQIPRVKGSHPSLVTLAFGFFKRIIQREVTIFPSQHGEDFKHLLDLVHNYCLPTTPKFLSSSSSRQLTILPSASMLRKRWISFKESEADSLLDINFVKGIVRIPPLKFLDHTELLFRNFIAFERCHGDKVKPVTSYVLLLHSLIQNEDDIRLLYKARILVNGLERKDQILDLLKNTVNKGATVDMDFYYGGLREKIQEYVENIKLNKFICLCC